MQSPNSAAAFPPLRRAVDLMFPTTASLSAEAATIGCLAALGALGIVAIRRACRPAGPLAGTTLESPCRWAMAAIAALIAAEILAVLSDARLHRGGWELLRYGAAILAFCPFVALLGAKRPQNSAWQFVVATFWIVLQTPAVHWWLFPSAHQLAIHGPWRAMLLLLMAMQCINYLATPAIWAVLLATAGQWTILAPFANLPPAAHLRPAGSLGNLLGPALLIAAVIAARRTPDRSAATGTDRAWRDFRDAFGAFWALRVAARFNVAAQAHGWNVRLRWTGWSRSERGADVDTLAPPAEKCFRMLLRRFLAPGRVAARISTDPASRLD